MDKRLAALIACSIGFGQIAGASPISEARIQELMASRDRQEVKLEALRSRDREILVQLGQVLSEKYGSLLEGSEMVFTRLVEQGTVYYRMDFVGLKGRDRARALCEILDVEKCIALGEHGQMTLLQTDGDLTVSATGVVEDTRAFAVLSDEPTPAENPKARQIEERVRRMLDPLGIFPMPRPDSVGAAALAADPVEQPKEPSQPEEPAEQLAGRSELDRMLEDGLSRAPEASRRPQARPTAPNEKITVVEYFEETESTEGSEQPSEVLIEIDDLVEMDEAANAAEVDEPEVAVDNPEVIVEIESAREVLPAPDVIVEIEDAKAQPTQSEVVVEIEDAKHDEAVSDTFAPEELDEVPAEGAEEGETVPAQEMQNAPVILLPEDLDIRIDVGGVETPSVVDAEPAQEETEAPDVLLERDASPQVQIEWEDTRPATAPEPQDAPVPAPEEATGPMMLTPDMQVETDAPRIDPVREETTEPASLDDSAMLSPDMPQSLAEEISRSDRTPRDIASTQDSFLSGALGTSPAAGSPKPGRTIAMRLPGLGEVDFGRLSPSAPSFDADGSARFPRATAPRKVPPQADRAITRTAPKAVESEISEVQVAPEPKPRISDVPEAVIDEKDQRAAEAVPAASNDPVIHPGPISRSAALEDTKPAPMRLASGPQSRDAALARVMAKAEPDLGAMPLSRKAALAAFEEERRMAELEELPEPLAREDALKSAVEIRVAQAAPIPEPRQDALEEIVELAAELPTPQPRPTVVADAVEPETVPEPAPRVAMMPLEGHSLKGGFEVNVPLDLEGMKGGYAAMDAPRLSSDPKVEVALLGTVHFDDQFAVPASLDFAHGRDAGRLQKLPDPRPDLEAVVKRQVSRAGKAAFDPQAARLALDISRGVHPGATLAQVPGLGGTASPDHGMAPPGFFGEEPQPVEPVETSPSLDRLEALLEAGRADAEPEVKNADPEPEAPKAAPALTGLDALLAATSRPKLNPEAEPAQKASPTVQEQAPVQVAPSAPEPSMMQGQERVADVKDVEAEAEAEKQAQSQTQRQALEILAQIARRAEQERQEAAQAMPEPVAEPTPEQPTVASRTLSERAAAPVDEGVDFDVADLRIELSYVDSREAVKARAGELRAFFPPVMLEKGRFFGASVPGRPGRYIVGLEAKDLKSRDDLIWYMDQMGMPWAMR